MKVGPIQTIDISGMGEGYEDECQAMLWRGVDYLLRVQPDPEMWKGASSYKNIYGVLMTEGAELKALEKEVVGEDCTGAMHQAVMSHLAYIHRHGHGGWLDKARAHDREVITFEGEV